MVGGGEGFRPGGSCLTFLPAYPLNIFLLFEDVDSTLVAERRLNPQFAWRIAPDWEHAGMFVLAHLTGTTESQISRERILPTSEGFRWNHRTFPKIEHLEAAFKKSVEKGVALKRQQAQQRMIPPVSAPPDAWRRH